MSILEKIRACIAEKMVNRSVPKMIADRVASEYVNTDITAVEFSEIDKGRMSLEYCNNSLAIKKVNLKTEKGSSINKLRLLSLTTQFINN